MNIYFAGSIRGGKDGRETYLKIIGHLKNFGNVLTEHVGIGETDKNDEKIYFRDTNWLNGCDVVIAEVSIPSLGVGYEIAMAEAMGKKILCLYDKKSEKKLSAMIAGNKKIIVEKYNDLNDVFCKIDNFFEKIK